LKLICAKLGIDWTSAPQVTVSQTFRVAKTFWSTTGVYSYTTPVGGGFKHCETSPGMLLFQLRRPIHVP